jgi:hypothetical protein
MLLLLLTQGGQYTCACAHSCSRDSSTSSSSRKWSDSWKGGSNSWQGSGDCHGLQSCF